MLPADIASIYRLFLRTAAASVLHHGQASKNLRLLWRPLFNTAMMNAKRAGDPRYVQEHRRLQKWLSTWERRVDGTLSMLANAAQYRGVPHKVTRNLALITGTHIDVHHDVHAVRTTWNPRLTPDSPEYQIPEPNSKKYSKAKQRQEWRAFTNSAMSVLGEAVLMAEAQQDLTLGRVVPR